MADLKEIQINGVVYNFKDTTARTQVGTGTPTIVDLVADMVDTTKPYLYVGSETGYTAGDWYYYDGSAWVSGGTYGTDGGVNTNARNILKYILQRVAYTETGMQTYVNALYQALAQAGGTVTTTYTIMNVLTNVTNSNDATGADEGDSYTATLTADTGYTIDSVVVTMGGVDVTSTVYSNGTITIASVTGDVIITAVAYDGVALTDGVYTPITVTRGTYINETGAIASATDDSGYFEEFIRVPSDCDGVYGFYSMDGVSEANSSYRITEYDSNQTFIKQYQIMRTKQFGLVFDSETRYIRLGFYTPSVATGAPEFTFVLGTTELKFAVGNIDSSGANDNTINTRIRSDYIPISANTITTKGCFWLTSKSNANQTLWYSWGQYSLYTFRCYDSNKTFLSTVGGSAQDDLTDVALPTGTAYVRMLCQHESDSMATGYLPAGYTMLINGVVYKAVSGGSD